MKADDLPACDACGKRCYPSWKVATQVARLASRGNDVHGKRRTPISVYRCADGHSIHLTSQKRRNRTKRTRSTTRRGR